MLACRNPTDHTQPHASACRRGVPDVRRGLRGAPRCRAGPPRPAVCWVRLSRNRWKQRAQVNLCLF